jgi:hypothetical protein
MRDTGAGTPAYTRGHSPRESLVPGSSSRHGSPPQLTPSHLRCERAGSTTTLQRMSL